MDNRATARLPIVSPPKSWGNPDPASAECMSQSHAVCSRLQVIIRVAHARPTTGYTPSALLYAFQSASLNFSIVLQLDCATTTMSTNPHQLFLLADHVKLSLLERQRAKSLNLEPNKQDGHITRSLGTLREGLDALERQKFDQEAAGEE